MPDLSKTLRTVFARALNRRTAVRRGRLDAVTGFHSEILGNDRQLTIYLPPGYDERTETRYPVLYMQDGQNLFDAFRAFAGNPWRLDRAADEAIGSRSARPMIIVGVDHANEHRVHEYTPVMDVARNAGGKAADYAEMLLTEVKPLIDAKYRTIGDDVSVGGSSLGGLISLYVALRKSAGVRAAAVMSPSVWWGGRAILEDVRMHRGPRPRLWLDIGGREGREALNDARALRDELARRGWSEPDFRYYEDRRADHSEHAWAARARKVLEFLFPPE